MTKALKLNLSLGFILAVSSVACEDPKDEPTTGGETTAGEIEAGIGPVAGEMPAGEVPAGEMPAGEVPAGEVPAGEMPAGEMPAGEVPAGEMPAGEMPAGEMPAGEMPAGEMPAGEMPAGEMPAGEMPAGEMPAGEMINACREDSECDEGSFCIAEVCVEVPQNEADFCRIHWPVRSRIAPNDELVFYARVYEEGLTDLSSANDQSPMLLAEIGMRLSGSEDEADFRWNSATMNEGYDGNTEGGEPNNDEYMATLTFPMEGNFEVAARFSVDYGQTWLLCDYGVEGAGSSDGYTGSDAAQVQVIAPCDEGFEFDENDLCQDIDECAVENGGCDLNASCTNNVGAAPTCACLEGYEGDGQSCTDIDECVVDNGGCDINAICQNNVADDPSCECRIGFEGNGQTCTDIDECATNNGDCSPNALCENNVGQAPTCSCLEGYEGDGQTCTDIDECAVNNGGCDLNALCTNNVAADPTCECNQGFTGNGQTCTDIDECAVENGGCDANADCTNNIGAVATCTCQAGYEGNGQSCTDIDECAVDNGGCHANAGCTNNVAADPTCDCLRGFEGDGYNCTDIDECAENNGDCDVNASCTNNIGDLPTCTCNEGYQGTGIECELIPPVSVNELEEGDLVITEIMANPVVAVDSDGEWFEIYSPNKNIDLTGLIVRDQGGGQFIVDPSMAINGQELVINQGEYFVFVRNSDRVLNGQVNAQVDYDTILLNNSGDSLSLYVNELLIDMVIYAQAEEGVSYSFNGEERPSAFNNDDQANFCAAETLYNEQDRGTPGMMNDACPPCPPGYEEVSEGVCEDINDCLENNGGCDANAHCINQEGSPRICECQSFYTGDGFTCTDIDECASNNGGCDEVATCTNNEGAAPTCECPFGYEGNGQTCTDIDECAVDNGSCDINADCENQIAEDPICTCRDGYEGDGFVCFDIDECAENNGGCDINAECTNNEGAAPTCTCNEFFIGDGQSCTAVPPNQVDYCRIQFPADGRVELDGRFDAYMRLYEAGMTDRTPGVDVDQRILIEFSTGPDGTIFSTEQNLRWIQATPTPNYDGNLSGEANNDEYLGQVQMENLGSYAFAFRASVDMGQNWTYCDLDGAGANVGGPPDFGYTPDQNGMVTVTCPSGQALIDGQCVIAFSEAEARTFIQSNCGGCHGGYPWYPNFPTNVINVSNGSYDYVEPGDYEQSYLWMKITGAPGIGGGQMPPGRTIPSSQINRFAAWILNLPTTP